MKKITSKNRMQKIIIAIVIVLSFNFIVPNYSRADFGGLLFGPIIDFVAGIGDAVLAALQYFMYDGGQDGALDVAGDAAGAVITVLNPFDSFLVNADEFDPATYGMEADGENGATVQIEDSELDKGWIGLSTYQIPVIQYTPEKIFSNQIPALDVNFINPTDWTQEEGVQNGEAMNSKSVAIALHSTIANWYVALRNLAIVALLSVLLYVGIRMLISSVASDKAKYKQMLIDWIVALCILFFLHYIMSFILTITDIITEGISSSSSIVVQINGGNVDAFKTNLTGLVRIQVQYKDLGIRMIYLIFYLALVIYTVMFTWTYIKRAITMAFLTLMAPLVAITYPIDKISDGKAQAFNIWLKEYIFNALLQTFHLIIYTIFLGSASQIAANNPVFAILFLAFIIPSEKLLRKMFGFDKSSTAGGMSTAASILGGAAVLKGARGLIGRAGKAGGAGSGAKGAVRTKNAITDSSSPSKVKDLIGTPNFDSNGVNDSGAEPASAPVNFDNAQNSGSGITDNTSQSNPSASGAPGANNAPGTPGLPRTNGNPIAGMNGQRESQTTKSWRERMRDNFAFKENDSRGMGQWIKEGVGKTLDDGKNSFMQNYGNKRFVRFATGSKKKIEDFAKGASDLYNKKNPIANTIRGAVGTIGKAAVGTAKFAGKTAAGVAIGGTIGLAAGIAGDDLEDVLTYGAAGAALGVTGLPVLGRGVSNAANNLRNTYATQAFGPEQAALRQQTRTLMHNEEYTERMDDLYTDMYGKKPTSTQSREFRLRGAEYNNAGITDMKQIEKSMKFEKELKENLMRDGLSEEQASENAKKQAMVISKMAQEIDKKELINEGKRNDRRNQIAKQLQDSGMDQKSAAQSADYTIKLIMQRQGLSPE